MTGNGDSTDTRASSRVTRRTLLKAAGATALTAGVVTATAPSAAADAGPFDAIVVGAGYAGGTVARELTARGMKVLVLEARDRIGGRIEPGTLAGQHVELGGGWFGPGQNLVARELSRYSLTTREDIHTTRMVMPGVGGGFQSHSPQEAGARLNTLFADFYAGSERYFERPYEPLHRKDLLASVDSLSLADRISQLHLSGVDHDWVSGATSVFAGGNRFGSLTGMAQWYQLAGGTYDQFLSVMSLLPEGGMISVLERMLAESGATVSLNSPVTAIRERGGLTQVEVSGGRVYKAPVVVVATPVNMWSTLTFEPGLPQVYADAAREGVGVPHATKLWLRVRGTSEAVSAQAPEGAPILLLIPQAQLPDGRLFVAFTGPSLNVSDPAAVRAAVRGLLPEARVVDYRAKEWHKDPYARGGWGLRRPGQLLRQLPRIQEPFGRVVFAGGDTASGWHGAFVEGALESGFRAADQAAAIAG
ncbi:NAD(P)/FAD-dependent oxidoreductase [Streptomyces sp. SID12488]|uniref:flavin monoamine oxidase family protein n=1 Tax=Streptomyces sp. SID12488 TaxID=2706040 RepID=UPI0013D96E7F|nr:NAD(P)/FAD-dependent oxidoreductase [Streptomyces sp. SID12488]NEA65800.1 FAD-dependent oxidoreductase [Streptomyces sp. SID12488]